MHACRIDVYSFWKLIFDFKILIEYVCDLRKGPAERAQFPTMSSVSSPYQQLGQFILVLGRKIDSAQELKADL